jgi:hypothetical protein
MKPNLTRLAVPLIAVALIAMTATAFAAKDVIHSGNLVLSDNGGLSPQKLPKRGVAPATARLEAQIGTLDGSPPPALRTIDLQVADNIHVDAVGLPVCAPKQIAATSSKTAKRACGDALIGSGSAEVEVVFPEQAPFSSTGPLLLFNGGVRGATTRVLLHAYVDVPAPTAIVVPADITRIHRAGYGLDITATLPPIAGGAGVVKKFHLQVGRKFSFEGRQRSFIAAGCPTGHWSTKGEAGFSDGTELKILHVFPCTPVP